MRTEQELRDKIREIEASHQCYSWDTHGCLDRDMKTRARNKIWGILYALGFAEEETLPLDFGEVQERIYEVVPDEPNMLTPEYNPGHPHMILTDTQKREYSRGMNDCSVCRAENCERRIIIDYCGLGDVPRYGDLCPGLIRMDML